jgi:hypothetical protein
LATIGCTSSGTRPQKVSGKVTLDDKPVAGALVTFYPIGDGQPANGKTDANGSFHLGTRETGDGIWPGHYKATVLLMPSAAEAGDAGKVVGPANMAEAMQNMGKNAAAARQFQAQSPVPVNYAELADTPLEYDIPAPGGTVVLALRSDIQPPPKRTKPDPSQRPASATSPPGGGGKAGAGGQAKKKTENGKNP